MYLIAHVRCIEVHDCGSKVLMIFIYRHICVINMHNAYTYFSADFMCFIEFRVCKVHITHTPVLNPGCVMYKHPRLDTPS